jgi:hypothetical protein
MSKSMSESKKKIFLLGLLFFISASFSFGQIYRCEAEGKTGPMIISLHFVDYGNYQYVFYTEEAVIFMNEENITQLRDILEKYMAWKALAQDAKVTVTKTIDVITFDSYYQNRALVRDPAVFYFVFTGGPIDPAAAETRYTLFVDTNLEKIKPFRLSSEQAQDFLSALLPEKLAESHDAYLERRAMEELFF